MCLLSSVFHLAAFFFLEESHHLKKKKKGRSDSSQEESSNDSESEDKNDFPSSLQSNDSGIELLTNERIDSDTELVDLTRSDIDDSDMDEVMVVESDIDTDSDFERVNSDTELLINERNEAKKVSSDQDCLFKFRQLCIPECIVTQCGPKQCYHSARNSVADSYDNVVACLVCLKHCGSCCQRKWTPGETRSGAKVKLRKAGQSVLAILRLMMDRRVFLSTLLYGLVAFLVIISNEVSCSVDSSVHHVGCCKSLSLSLSLSLSSCLSLPPSSISSPLSLFLLPSLSALLSSPFPKHLPPSFP